MVSQARNAFKNVNVGMGLMLHITLMHARIGIRMHCVRMCHFFMHFTVHLFMS